MSGLSSVRVFHCLMETKSTSVSAYETKLSLSLVHHTSCSNLVNFSVTVLEHRNSAFLSLSDADLDQILVNTAMGECTLSVDTLIGKAKEFDLHTNSVKIMRELGEILTVFTLLFFLLFFCCCCGCCCCYGCCCCCVIFWS